MIERKWFSVELNQIYAQRFRDYLNDRHVKFESSACFDLIHFECFVTGDEANKVNEFLDAMYNEERMVV